MTATVRSPGNYCAAVNQAITWMRNPSNKAQLTMLTEKFANLTSASEAWAQIEPTLPTMVMHLSQGQWSNAESLFSGVNTTWTWTARTPERCSITDLLDHAVYPAGQLAAAYAWRWAGSETALKEAKSAITGAGPSTGPIFRSATPELIAQEHAAWICGTELIRALARAAARQAAPARKGRLAGRKVQPRQISFTSARRAALASIRSGTATARPKPARPSPAPDAASPPAPRSPGSTSARRSRPDRHHAVTIPDPCQKPPDMEPAARPER